MEYEQTVKGTSFALEGTADQQPQPYLPRWKRNKTNAKSKDHNIADVNDPCCPNADGYGEYRNRDQIERQTKDVARLQKQQHEHATNLVGSNAASASQEQPSLSLPSTSSSYNIQQSIWYYQDNTSGAIQGPFSGEQMMGWRSFFPWNTPVRYGHDSGGTFMMLSEVDFTNLPNQLIPPPPPPLDEEVEEESAMPGNDEYDTNGENGEKFELEQVQAQVVRMPPLCTEDDATELQIHDQEVDICIPPPSDDDEDSRDAYQEDTDSIEKNTYPEVDACIPPPSDDEADEENELDEKEVDMCVPPPSDDEEGYDANVPYPVDEEYAYPTDGEVPYPVDVDYPVDDVYGYPVNDDAYGNDTGDMAAVAPYPSDNLHEEWKTEDHPSLRPVAEVKKKFKGDKAVVGFVPSHLRVKRNVSKPSKPKPKSIVSQSKNSQDDSQETSSVTGDYNEFMENIAQLK